MCYHYSPAHLNRLKKLYPDKFENLDYPEYANGFTHPEVPSVTSNGLALHHWGLIPHWTQDMETAQKMRRFCLNAKIETLAEKPSFRNALKKKQFCVLPARNFYEWQWQDKKGKEKIKYDIQLADNELMYLGGLYSEWLHKETGELISTATIITCPANSFMEKIHNTKKRMPIILNELHATNWINGTIDLIQLKNTTQEQTLIAKAVNNEI